MYICKNACLYACNYTSVYMYTTVVCIHVCMHKHDYMYSMCRCIHVCMYMCMHVNVCTGMFMKVQSIAYTCTFMCVHMSVCMYACVRMYVCILRPNWRETDRGRKKQIYRDMETDRETDREN